MKHDSRARSLRSRREVAFAGSAADPAQFPKDRLPEVAFLGRSNVGKSTLLNALAGTRGLARVSLGARAHPARELLQDDGSPEAGRTRTRRALSRGPARLRLRQGLARGARELREDRGLLPARREALRLCVFIVDARHEPGERDEALRSWLDHHGLPWALAVNKIDTLSRNEARARVAALESGLGQTAGAVLPVSAERGTGVEELWNAIRAAAFEAPSPDGAVPATRGPDGRC